MTSPANLLTNSLRVAPNLRHAFGGVWRLAFGQYFAPKQWIAVLSPVVLVGVLAAATVHAQEEHSFFQLATNFYLTFLVPVLAFISGAGAIRDEMKAADYLTTRSLPRPAFFVFKYLAHTACVQLASLLALGTLLAVGSMRNVPGVFSAVPLLLLGQVLEISAFVAFGMLCGVLTSKYLLIGLFYAGTVEVGIGAIPTQLNQLSITHQIRLLLAPLRNGDIWGAAPMENTLGTIGIILLFTVLSAGIGATIFGTQELAGSRPQDG